jgi:RND family efflux transporter MFP subunit
MPGFFITSGGLMRLVFLLIPLLLSGQLLARAPGDSTPVTLVPLEQLWFNPEQSAPARVMALNRSRLAAEIDGRIINIHVTVGSTVKKGDILVSLDCRDHQSRLIQQQAELERLQMQKDQAQRRLQRARELSNLKNMAEEETDLRQTELNSLLAQIRVQQETIALQQRNLDRCRISAPFDGLVEERLAAQGELAAPGTPLIRLIQLDQAEVEAHLRPEVLDALDETDALFIWMEQEYPVTLVRRFATIDPRAGTRSARFRFSDRQAPPGAAGRLTRRDPRKHIPADYLQKRADRLGLFIRDNQQARFHPLPAGAIEGRPAPVDLPADTEVIDQGRHGLRDGDPISQ